MIWTLAVLIPGIIARVILSMGLRSVAISGINKGVILLPISYESEFESLLKLF